MDTSADFAAFLNEKLKNKGLSVKKLADMTGVPLNHLTNLAAGEYRTLPPAPYLRGYLQALGAALDFDPQAAWDHFKQGSFVTTSGGRDELPTNRFAPRSVATLIWVGGAVLALLVYFGMRSSFILGRPAVTITEPAESLVRTTESAITLTGRIENGDTLTVNGETIVVGGDGTWEKRFPLQPGLNTVAIEGKKFLGGTVQVIRQVMYEPARAIPVSTSTLPAPGDGPAE